MAKYEKAVYDKYADNYDEGLKELLGGGMMAGDTKKFAEYKVQVVKNLCKPSPQCKILDFGCGTGRSLFFLNQYFGDTCELFGCDVSRESLKVAAKAVPNATLFLNAPIEELECFDCKFDIVILACVLHHIDPKEREMWIKAIIKKLNVGGKIVVFEHNTINPMTRKIILKPQNVDNIKWMLTMSDISRLLLCDKAMRLKWKGYTLFSPFRSNIITQMERGLKWFPLGAQQCIVAQKFTDI